MFWAVCSVNEAQEEGHGEKPFFQTVELLLAAFPGGGLSLGPVCCLSVHSSFPYIRNWGPIKSLYVHKLIWINLLSCSKRGKNLTMINAPSNWNAWTICLKEFQGCVRIHAFDIKRRNIFDGVAKCHHLKRSWKIWVRWKPSEDIPVWTRHLHRRNAFGTAHRSTQPGWGKSPMLCWACCNAH